MQANSLGKKEPKSPLPFRDQTPRSRDRSDRSTNGGNSSARFLNFKHLNFDRLYLENEGSNRQIVKDFSVPFDPRNLPGPFHPLIFEHPVYHRRNLNHKRTYKPGSH